MDLRPDIRSVDDLHRILMEDGWERTNAESKVDMHTYHVNGHCVHIPGAIKTTITWEKHHNQQQEDGEVGHKCEIVYGVHILDGFHVCFSRLMCTETILGMQIYTHPLITWRLQR